ncbi:MmcQ/YjbR family DNA-binding protein [Brevundimonas sp.]|uniref:MmcQ/YjbR family DNA-binding protein n=1 Tax=Brevundimonas sp. TaxID=1871086 RepID=UPI002489EB9E|nr:MmcQ/YjbR family DNA-binding protein [Brevundimonas sp.]MDI1281753.1 MmcQ/YjbR family DNA-binding protein [Brevundimonas sp.]
MNAAGQVALAKALLDAMPGAAAEPARVHGVTTYKLMGKMFAILSARGDAAVSLKCDPHRADLLREQYSGIGHRYHLDRRHWISVALDRDVPRGELERLIDHSYALVMAKLTRSSVGRHCIPPGRAAAEPIQRELQRRQAPGEDAGERNILLVSAARSRDA